MHLTAECAAQRLLDPTDLRRPRFVSKVTCRGLYGYYSMEGHTSYLFCKIVPLVYEMKAL